MTGVNHSAVNFKEEIKNIQSALIQYDAGVRKNVAIIGLPFSGKTTLIDEIIERYGKPIRKVVLPTIIRDAGEIFLEDAPERIIAIDDCQRLFVRQIGGFNVLEKFLDTVVRSDRLFITIWSQFSWNYLKEVFHMDDYFPVKVTTPPLGPDEIEAMIGSRDDLDQLRYVNDAVVPRDIVKVDWKDVRFAGLHFSVPVIMIKDTIIASSEIDVRRKIFEEIGDLSDGNPGVALAIWERAHEGDTVRAGKVGLPDYDMDLSYDEVFVLSSILMAKSATEEDLILITEGRLKIDRILYMLMNRSLIVKSDERYRIEPLALHSVVKTLKKNRQVW